ncbi:MAG: alpha/beta hydrolase family protein [Novosphingobium sp.]
MTLFHRFLGASALALAAAGTAASIPAVASDIVVTAANGRIPVAEFVKKANMRTPRISPNGRYLAYLANNGGKEILVVLDLATPGSAPKPILAAEEAREAGDRSMAGFRWIGNDHVVMTTLSREDYGSGPGDYRRLVAYSVSTGKLVQQAWRGAGSDAATILYIDSDKGEYLLQRDTVGMNTEKYGLPEVVRVNVATGDYKIVQPTNPVVFGWAADGDGIIRAGFNRDRDNGKIRMMYRSNGSEQFRTVYNEADKTFTESVPAPQMFIPGTDTAYTVSRTDGFTKVYKIDMKTMKMDKPEFETTGFDIQGIITDFDDKRLVGYQIFNGEMRSIYVDPDLNAIKGFLNQTFGQNEARIEDYDREMRNVIVYAGGKSKGGAYYLYDTQAGKMNLLNWTRNGIKDAPLNPVKAEWYTASDGTRIQAIVTYPRHRDPKNLPVVVMPHGGPFGALSATNQLEPWNQPLAEAGYVVIQPNYRGSGGYGKAFEKLGREPGGYGKRMQDDLNDVVKAYADKGVVDPSRACIMGWSYGGYAAARGAQRDASVWKCAIAGAGVYDMPLMNTWDTTHLGKFSSGFQATSNDPEEISSARNTGGKWAPILIVAGVRDQRIPLEQSRTLVSRLKSSGKKEGVDFKYIEQPQGTHNLPYDDVHIQWIEEAEQWLARFNPAYIASDSDRPPPLLAKH